MKTSKKSSKNRKYNVNFLETLKYFTVGQIPSSEKYIGKKNARKNIVDSSDEEFLITALHARRIYLRQ